MKQRLLACASVLTLLAASAASAADAAVEEVVITASSIRSLGQFTPTASRLGLSALETPATIDAIDSGQILGRGFHTVEEATATLPGVLSASPPGDMGNFSMRGFTGNQITLLYNGLNLGPATMIARPGNSFNLASIEVLKGPASVLYGAGAVGGAINVVGKAPSLDDTEVTALASVGSFGSTNLGLGVNLPLGATAAFRIDASRTSTNHYVHDAAADSLNVTGTILWRPSTDVELQFTLDFLNDNPSNYFGTPLVPNTSNPDPLGVVSSPAGASIDSGMRYVNYNVSDSRIHSRHYWPQAFLTWSINENLEFSNFLYYFTAEREWMNSETYAFNAVTDMVDRDRFFVFHDHESWGNQADITARGNIGMMQNTFVIGIDYGHLDFQTRRGFPGGDSVDRYNPVAGVFGPLSSRLLTTDMTSFAVFAEDALDVTEDFKIVTGVRYDNIDLDRKNYDFAGNFVPGTSFQQDFKAFSWRIGAIYDLTDTVTPYVSFSTGKDPSGTSNFFLVNAGQNFDLSGTRQIEGGIKFAALDGSADLTVAAYSIERSNILTQINNMGDVNNIGSQKSRGVEISGDLRVTNSWTVSGNVAYVDAYYGDYVDPDFGVDATGNRPANVAEWIVNAWTSVRNIAGLPLEAGAGLRYVGQRYGDSVNFLSLEPYTLVDTYVSYEISPGILVTGRAKNVFDRAYAQWADIYYPTQVMLGAPRTFEFSVLAAF